MAQKTYSEKLLDPRWQKKRLKILKRDKWACRVCSDESNTLHVHHTHYEPGKEPWESEDKFLLTLCKNCHEMESKQGYKADKLITAAITKSGFSIIDKLYIAAGFEWYAWYNHNVASREKTYSFLAMLLASPQVLNDLISKEDELFSGKHYEILREGINKHVSKQYEEIFEAE